MYAVIELAGKQYKVEKGEEVIVDRLDLAEGKSLTLKPLLLGGEKQAVTAKDLKGARVKAKVEEHLLGGKIKVFTYKPKRGYKKMKGHRSRLSRVTIQSITAGAKKRTEPAEKEDKKEKAGKVVKAKAAKASPAIKAEKPGKAEKAEKPGKPGKKG